MVADVQLQDMLPYLDIPTLVDGKYNIVESEPNDDIQNCVDEFVERAKNIRNGIVDPSEDNMLKICHDAKLVSTDIRMLYPDAEPDPQSKLYRCIENVYQIWRDTADNRGTQVVFSDIGVPNGGKGFDVYQFIKDGLVAKGVPAEEICFIHDAKNEKDRNDMFQDLRNGVKRVIIGSTEKMGTGTNIQTRLYALHEIDVPWRPSDVEQREGRILRQGNMYDKVQIFRYVTKGTFDAYNWSIIENKQKFISQVMTNGDVARTCTDIDEAVLNYAEMKAIASGDPLIKEKMEVEAEITRLNLLKRSYTSERYQLERDFKQVLPDRIERLEAAIGKFKEDIVIRDSSSIFQKGMAPSSTTGSVAGGENSEEYDSPFVMTFRNREYTERKEVGELICNLIKQLPVDGKPVPFGEYAGFSLSAYKTTGVATSDIEAKIDISGNMKYTINASVSSDIGNVVRIQNAMKGIEKHLAEYEQRLQEAQGALVASKEEFEKPFSKENELASLLERQRELMDLLSVEDTDPEECVDVLPKLRHARV